MKRPTEGMLLAGLCLLMTLFAYQAHAQVPAIPHAFYGVVEINGEPASVGAQVEARGTGVLTGVDGNPIAVTEVGEYGGPGGDSVINTDENWRRSYISYKYFSITRRDTRMPLPLRLCEYPHLLKDDSSSRRWLMSDWVRKHAPVFPHMEKGGWGGGRNVLFADTSVQFVRHRTPGAF